MRSWLLHFQRQCYDLSARIAGMFIYPIPIGWYMQVPMELVASYTTPGSIKIVDLDLLW